MTDKEKRVMNVTIVDAETGETIEEFKDITSISGVFMTEEGSHTLSYIQATTVDMAILMDQLMNIIDELGAKHPEASVIFMGKRLGIFGEETKEGDDS